MVADSNRVDDDIQAVRERVDSFLVATASLIEDQPDALVSDSPAVLESQAFIRKGAIENVVTQTHILMEAAADEVQSFMRLTTPPVQTKSPFTCVRASLESAALAAWLLCPEIDADERVRRSMAYRYEGLVHKRRLLALDCVSDTIESPDLATAALRLDELADQASEMGFETILDKNGRRIGIGTRYPNITSLIGQELEQEHTYRLLSAAAHSHMWALIRLTFIQAGEPGGKDGTAMQKGLEPEAWLYLCVNGIRAFAIVLCRRFRYLGWDAGALDGLLRELFGGIGLPVPDL